jgi:long-chain acyl-CoA synthetase
MSISILLEMAASNSPERSAVVCGDICWSAEELNQLADGGAAVIAQSGCKHVAYIGTGGAYLPLLTSPALTRTLDRCRQPLQQGDW